MKFMGSKRWMLKNGLADIICDRVPEYGRFVDLFSGSAVVSWHVAQTYSIPVLANDLQEFCRALAASVICRTGALGHDWIDCWISRASFAVQADPLFPDAERLQVDVEETSIVEFVESARLLCEKA